MIKNSEEVAKGKYKMKSFKVGDFECQVDNDEESILVFEEVNRKFSTLMLDDVDDTLTDVEKQIVKVAKGIVGQYQKRFAEARANKDVLIQEWLDFVVHEKGVTYQDGMKIVDEQVPHARAGVTSKREVPNIVSDPEVIATRRQLLLFKFLDKRRVNDWGYRLKEEFLEFSMETFGMSVGNIVKIAQATLVA